MWKLPSPMHLLPRCSVVANVDLVGETHPGGRGHDHREDRDHEEISEAEMTSIRD